ncbi:MAG: DivIVA domain-containing protein, partial [Acidimicrobiia bacterium]
MSPDVSGPVDPDRILDRTFSTVRRGADPAEVEGYLRQIAGQMRAMTARIGELERALAAAQSTARAAPIDLGESADLTRIVGEETARVLDAARAAAADIRARAEESVDRMVREAHDESVRVRHEAESLAAQRMEEADSLVARRTVEAEAAASEVRNRLEIDLARAEADGIAIIDDAKRRGREMLAEAQEVRQRMLDDLSRRRQGLRDQIEQLQASRDRLLAAFDSVRTTVAVATDEVKAALPDGRIAAEQAALKAVEAELAETITTMTEADGLDADPPAPSLVVAPPIVETPAPEPPRLTVVPPPVESAPVDAAPTDPPPVETSSEDAAPAETVRIIRAPGPAPAARPEPRAAAQPRSEPPPEPEPVPEPTRPTTLRAVTEGRTSSSVRVVRSGKAADVFARLREEGEVETTRTRSKRSTPEPSAPAAAVVEVAEVA